MEFTGSASNAGAISSTREEEELRLFRFLQPRDHTEVF